MTAHRSLLVAALSAMLFVCGFASAPGESKAAPDFDRKNETAKTASPPMFRLSEGAADIYFVGTFHALPADLDWRSDTLAAVLDKADTIVFEAEVDTSQAQKHAQKLLTTEGALPPGKSLSALLGEKDAARLAQAAADVGVPAAAFETMRPWQAFLVLTVRQIIHAGFDPEAGVEQKMLAEARLRGRTLRFFETIDDQLGFFAQMTPVQEKSMLSITLRDWDKGTADLNEALDAWKKGDVAAIDRTTNGVLRKETPEIYQRLLVKRNQNWADVVESMTTAKGTILIAVGAAHLSGPDSLPEILKKRGHKVERIGVGGASQ